MKRKVKKIICCALLFALICSLTACGKEESVPNRVEEFGDIDGSTEISENETDTDDENVSLPTYNTDNVSQPQSYPSDEKVETKYSYYKEQLGTRPKKAFDAIYSAASNKLTNVEFESSQFVTPSELKNIMNIIFCDCPELFYLDDNYTYVVNTEGYVTNVSIAFSMDSDTIENIEYSLAVSKPGYLELRQSNDYRTIQNVISELEYEDYGAVYQNNDGTYDKNCEQQFYGTNKNSVGISKLLCYWLRQLGIDATIVLGEPVSNTLTDDCQLTFTDVKFCDETPISENSYSVTFNYSYYWMWNVVKIDDNWYNLDMAYSLLLGQYDSLIPSKSLYFVPDRLMSQTRLSYINEEILGISPSCTDMNYQASYRDGYYILPHTETQAILRLKQEIAYIDQNNASSITYQFEDEDTFNYFLNNIDAQMEYYNKTYSNPIGIYKVMENRDSLVIVIYNIVNNF